jgi:hypothetical protein
VVSTAASSAPRAISAFQEDKSHKHAPFYAPIGFAFFALVISCFGSIGPTAGRCIFSLADLEMRQHESLLACQGLCTKGFTTCSPAPSCQNYHDPPPTQFDRRGQLNTMECRRCSRFQLKFRSRVQGNYCGSDLFKFINLVCISSMHGHQFRVHELCRSKIKINAHRILPQGLCMLITDSGLPMGQEEQIIESKLCQLLPSPCAIARKINPCS